jgi:hypothetical protein
MATLTDLPAETDALPGGHESPAEAAEDDEKELPEIAAELWQIVTRVSAEEFRWQESHYDSDSRRGRELLFLIANNEWVRATSEIIDISRSDSIETTIKIVPGSCGVRFPRNVGFAGLVQAVTGRRVWRWVCCPCASRRRDRFQGGRGSARCPAAVAAGLRLVCAVRVAARAAAADDRGVLPVTPFAPWCFVPGS